MTNLAVFPNLDQKLLTNELRQDILDLINSPKYDFMYGSAILGALEMVKMQYYLDNFTSD